MLGVGLKSDVRLDMKRRRSGVYAELNRLVQLPVELASLVFEFVFNLRQRRIKKRILRRLPPGTARFKPWAGPISN